MIITLKINNIERKLDIDINNEKELVINEVIGILNYLEDEEDKQPKF